MNGIKDMSGQKFGRLTVISFVGRRKIKNAVYSIWLARCDCGNVKEVRQGNLTGGSTNSCGCFRREFVSRVKRTHGHTAGGRQSPDVMSYQSMHDRCYDPKCNGFHNYGGRGIGVCERWHKFESFLEDMGPRPVGCSLDRIDVTKDYSPENCRWASTRTQSRNKRTSRLITINGETLTLAEWSERAGKRSGTIAQRIDRGWSPEKAVFGELIRNNQHH